MNFDGTDGRGKLVAETATIGWMGKPEGYHRWTMSPDVSFGCTAGSRIYQNRYASPPNVYLSGGGIRIISYDGDWIFGEFNLSPAGWTEATQTGAGAGKVNIRGVFRVRKV
ncbi:MAG: hypothetical protein JWP57_1004 [Spirosoma sp.]|nr:hypothetical protein [Spirosoma sp.]